MAITTANRHQAVISPLAALASEIVPRCVRVNPFSCMIRAPKLWKKGNRYKYNLTLTDRDIAIKSTEITEWSDGWSGSGDDKGDDSLKPDGF